MLIDAEITIRKCFAVKDLSVRGLVPAEVAACSLAGLERKDQALNTVGCAVLFVGLRRAWP